MLIREQEREQEQRATQLRSNENTSRDISIGGQSPNLFPVPVNMPSQAKNQLLNGDASHSQRTWNSAVALNDDMNKECAYFFSNTAPALGQVLSSEDLFHNPATANETLKSASHSGWTATYAQWDSANGYVKMGTEKTLDLLLPGKFVIASRTHYVAFIMAKASQYIVFPSSAYLYAGFWLNNAGSSYWLQGTNPFTVSGTPSSAFSTTRKYRVFARTDRARSILSSELTLTTAPSDAEFTAGGTVSLSWSRLNDLGILSYDIYRLTGTTYVLLERVDSGAITYIDNNSVYASASAYPTATDDRSTALVTTRTEIGTESILNLIAIDGVSPSWSSFTFPVIVPNDYNLGTGSEQWLRIGIGGLTNNRADLQIPEVTIVSGIKTTVTTTTGLFTASMVGAAVTITNAAGDKVNTTVDVFVSSNEIELVAIVTSDTYAILITGGAPEHSLYLDCIHSSYGDNATFGNNDQDYTPPRPQNPVAAPNGSNQGGTGTGTGGGDGSDGGGPTCVEVNEPVCFAYGNQLFQKRAGDITIGTVVESGNLQPNVITAATKHFCDNIWHIETQNGCTLNGSPSHPVYRSRMDKAGVSLDRVEVGEKILTMMNGVYRQSKVVSVGATGRSGYVVKFSCLPSSSFVAGKCKKGIGGIVSHNTKQSLPQGPVIV